MRRSARYIVRRLAQIEDPRHRFAEYSHTRTMVLVAFVRAIASYNEKSASLSEQRRHEIVNRARRGSKYEEGG
jgi:hypothetical protein